MPALPGDVFLLCSDGLTTMVDPEAIGAIVLRHRDDLREATRALIAAANDHGGDDNVTAVLFEVAEADAKGDTLEAPAIVMADPDEADTLHPEDHVVLPTAVAAVERELPRERYESDTVIVSAAEMAAAQAAAGDGADTAGLPVDEAPGEPREPSAPLWRYALSLLVIVVLAGVIVLLVTRGLAR